MESSWIEEIMFKSIKIRQEFRYLLFGLVSFLVELVSFWGLNLILPIYAAATVSFLFGLCSSFIFNKFLVFQSTKKSGRLIVKEMIPFLALGLINSQVSSVLTLLLSQIMWIMFAKIITMAFVVAYTYFVMNTFIFKPSNRETNDADN